MSQIVPYRISKINTRQFAVFPNNFTSENVEVTTTMDFNVKKKLDEIRCICEVRYQNQEKVVMTVEVACFFGISPDGVETLKRDNRISLDFLRYMGAIVVGIMRGIIHAKTEGTVVNQIVLPPINLDKVITEDMILQ